MVAYQQPLVSCYLYTTIIRQKKYVQNLDEAVCIFHSANTLRKGMKQTILPPAMGK